MMPLNCVALQNASVVIGNRNERVPTVRIGVCFGQHKCRSGGLECVSVMSMPVGEKLFAYVHTRLWGADCVFVRSSS